MYTLQSVIIDKGKIVDEVNYLVSVYGIFEYDVNKGFLLNGKQVKMNGVCLHHDAGSVGAAVPIAMWDTQATTIKRNGLQCHPDIT